METHKGVLFTSQHRDKSHKNFKLNGSFKVGLGSTQVGNKQHLDKPHLGHFKMHPFNDTAVYLKAVEDQDVTPEQKEAYGLASRVIELVDPEWAAGEYLVQFSHMNSKDHYVKKHTDKDDISHQFLFAFGEYQGKVYLRVYDQDGTFADKFNCKNRVLKVDGRRPHRLYKSPDFEGDRFAVIWYKTYDARMTEPAPVLERPEFVYG